VADDRQDPLLEVARERQLLLAVLLLRLLRGAPLGAGALLVASAAWAFGSLWSKRQDMPPAAMSTAAQMLTGGVALTVLALLAGEHLPTAPGLRATLALVYLGVAGSIVGFSAYMYLLNQVRPALATSYAYVNPPVAVLFGVLLGGLPSVGIPAMGLIVGIFGLTLVAALAGDEFKLKEVLVLAVILAVGSYLAFIVLLKLQIPVWPTFISG